MQIHQTVLQIYMPACLSACLQINVFVTVMGNKQTLALAGISVLFLLTRSIHSDQTPLAFFSNRKSQMEPLSGIELLLVILILFGFGKSGSVPPIRFLQKQNRYTSRLQVSQAGILNSQGNHEDLLNFFYKCLLSFNCE